MAPLSCTHTHTRTHTHTHTHPRTHTHTHTHTLPHTHTHTHPHTHTHTSDKIATRSATVCSVLVLPNVGQAKGGQGAARTAKTAMKATPLKLNPLFRHPDMCIVQLLGSEKWQNESSPNFLNFCPGFPPEFCSEFSPNFSRSFRASFPRRRRPEKIHQKSRLFSMQNSQANTKKHIHIIFLESRQTNSYCSRVVAVLCRSQIL